MALVMGQASTPGPIHCGQRGIKSHGKTRPEGPRPSAGAGSWHGSSSKERNVYMLLPFKTLLVFYSMGTCVFDEHVNTLKICLYISQERKMKNKCVVCFFPVEKEKPEKLLEAL